MVTIKPGMMADVMFEGSETKSISSMKTMIYDVEGRKIILSQTTPPITKAHQGKRLLVTFLEKKRRNPSQVWFLGKTDRFFSRLRDRLSSTRTCFGSAKGDQPGNL